MLANKALQRTCSRCSDMGHGRIAASEAFMGLRGKSPHAAER
jgi:hypothetical protein